jgi:hypothetical protein
LATVACWLAFVSAATAAPPTNLTRPSVSGTPQQGQTLTLTRGTWNDPTATISDQWERCSAPTTCTAISGQTGTTYVLTAADVGQTIQVSETATATDGTKTTATSVATAPVKPLPPAQGPPAPSISGVAQQGSVLTEQHGGWTNTPTSYTYQWYRCTGTGCTAIAGATAQTYTLTAADVGATIVVEEIASNAGGPGPAYSSSATALVTPPPAAVPVPVSGSPPVISGSTQQGQTLYEAHGTWSNNPTSFSYQWERCGGSACDPIPGATGPAYTTTAGDVGRAIVVLETAANTGGSGAAAASAPTGVVTATSALSLVVSSPAPTTNQTVALVATVSSSSGNAMPSGSITFLAGSSAIAGCAHMGVGGGQGAAVLCEAAFPAGTAVLSAVFTPAAGAPLSGSSSAPATLHIARSPTSTSLAVTKQVGVGKRARYTATVVLPTSNSGPLAATGSIEFLDRGRPIPGCQSRPLSQSAATCVVRYKKAGTHPISAVYSGDANFVSSASSSSSVRVGKSSSQPVVLGFINSTLQWQFYYHPGYTQVTVLRAFGIARASTIAVACHGAGCAFRQLRMQGGKSSMNLLPAFRKRHLRAGAQIVVRITREHWIGKYYSFTIRPGRAPAIVLSCLGVGRTRPGVGC